ncbi:hypothetical protein [Extensimonas vulgaris]|uniref:Uncharacterized protein n=1 Tax=Extensimonas vulgaris TaxID=1031594 RepID=A0A369ANQ9_9BURK|nr:hypothetical protein [Extensimonas vulgaris]MBC7215659.1 hypothetical protein [Burkholderiaceae bacterium]RCX10725.1 hypothetical protein DFR45_102126 [Extensimonas vulgaris]TWI41367.1 hypothetical protein IP95_00124 [Extensimonas vulgaris]TXD16834.1 hypothetical protein FUT63_02250 [Extensimonas vulgaris]
MTQDSVKVLATGVATLGEAVEEVKGELAVVVCALAALLRTHPDGQAFAAELRRAWLQIGAPNQALAADDATGRRMREVLVILEECCSTPLNILPPSR